jgi:23S rRNA G2069 N7-methylase RlmK/C1962 C5-methylase RlmI
VGRAAPQSYDLIVLDPPSFSTSRGGHVFTVASDWGGLVHKTLGLLASGGRLLTVTHHRGASGATLRRALSAACRRAHRQPASVRDMPLPVDCPAPSGEPTPTRAAWLSVR